MEPNWKELLKIAYEEATNSPDPSTQNGALLVNDSGEIVAREHNRFPKGLKDLPERWDRPLKYKIILHAERNVIYHQARLGAGTYGLTMVSCWACCSECARGIIESGIKRLVTHKQALDRSPDFWQTEIDLAFMMLIEAGIEIIQFDGEIGGPKIRHSGEEWSP